MKKYFYLFIFLLFFCSCNKNKFLTKNNKGIEVILDFNPSRISEFGVPLQRSVNQAKLHLNYGDTTVLDVSGVLKIWINKKLTKISFNYEGTQGYVSGTCIVPPFKEVKYQRVFDPDTYMITSLTPRYAYRLIRQGQWIVIRDGKREFWNYNIKINTNYLK